MYFVSGFFLRLMISMVKFESLTFTRILLGGLEGCLNDELLIHRSKTHRVGTVLCDTFTILKLCTIHGLVGSLILTCSGTPSLKRLHACWMKMEAT